MDHKSKILPKPKYLLLQLHSLEAKRKAKITSSLTVRFSSFKGTLSEPWMSQPQTTLYPSGQLSKLHAHTCWCPKQPSLGLNSQFYTIILLSSGSSGSASSTNTKNSLFQETKALGILTLATTALSHEEEMKICTLGDENVKNRVKPDSWKSRKGASHSQYKS